VRATDEFMQAVIEDRDWWTKSRVTDQPVKRIRARDLMKQIAEATHQCGDPGMQFDTTINRWHTSKNTARINASNPCSEYMFLDDSACNLASLNLMKFVGPDGQFDVEAFRHAVDTVTLAQEIIVDNASYPTDRIAAIRTISVRSAWASQTSAHCSCRWAFRTTAIRAATGRERLQR
jgi:ribonucleoside-diphosphate reductase alpha chain